jgi:putative transposase
VPPPETTLRRISVLAGRFRASWGSIRAVFEVRFLVEAFDGGFEPKAFKVRCYLTAEQRRLFAQTEGATRYVRNRVLREMDEYHQATGGYKTLVEMSREVTRWKKQEETIWLGQLPSDPIAQELRDLDRAFQNFFAGRAKYPKKKRKLFGCAVRFVFDHRHAGKVKAWNSQTLILPKLGKIKLAQPERLPAAMPKLVTLSRDGAGRYFVAFAVEIEIQPLPPTGVSVGVDVGIKALAVESDGTPHEGAKALRRKLRHLKRQQRALSRKQGARKGERKSNPNRCLRQARRVGRLHARIADARRDAQHKASTAIVRKADVIALEDLNVQGMLANGRLARHIADQGFAELRRQIEYKAGWHGRVVLRANRWAPTSKMCSGCGHVLDELKLSIRTWTCPACGAEHDRDINAARNILKFGTAGNAGIDARGQSKNLPESEVFNLSSGTLGETRTQRGRAASRTDREVA